VIDKIIFINFFIIILEIY